MNIFEEYAAYYNLLYQDKDYAGESAFVLEQLQQGEKTPRTVLDLGCGTGRHALAMARQGVQVTGVDRSPHMLDMGRTLRDDTLTVSAPHLMQGDARTVRLGHTVDAVTSLFHIMSYQTTEDDALAVLETARAHLQPGGLFLFDFWYGPCVLHERPEPRKKIMCNDDINVVRTARPVLRINENIVDVHYDVHIQYLQHEKHVELNEVHSMRYWFLPELHFLVRQAGLKLVREGVWLTQDPPSDTSWSVWMLVSL